jgi:hypothetical protein
MPTEPWKRRLKNGFHFAPKHFMVPRDFAAGEVRLSINIKGLAVCQAFGG